MKELKFEIPAGCEVDKIETQDGHIVVTFKEKLPKFKAGDVLKCTATGQLWLRLKEGDNVNSSKTVGCIGGCFILASEEERDKFFEELEDNGYVWDGECLELRKKERKLPKSWEEFCEMFPIKENQECFIFEGNATTISGIKKRRENMIEILPDRATSEAVLALCQLIQLRNCYNGDWVPDWNNIKENKWTIIFYKNKTDIDVCNYLSQILYFKTQDLRDEFLRYFRPLIEKLKPLYGIKEGGAE